MSEVYIDGVNVAECEYFNNVINEEPYCNIDEEHLYTCNSDNNCYFKQLQRAKADIEELKEYNDSYDIDVRALLSENDKLQAELTVQKAVAKGFSEGLAQTEKLLEKVKAENEKLKKDIHNIYENCKYCDEFYMDKCNYIKKENKYKQALEEIRAYCMTDNIQKYTNDIFYFGKHSHNILKIINEVLT